MDNQGVEHLVARLRAIGRDDERIEAKTCATTLSADVWETVSAFANTDGGTLLLGLDEREGFEPCPSFDLDRVLSQFVEGMGDGGGHGGRLTHPPQYRPTTAVVDGIPILAVDIAENAVGLKPCYITRRAVHGGSYKRVGDKDRRLSMTEIFEMQTATMISEADRRVVDDVQIDDLDETLVDRYVEAHAGSRALAGIDQGDRAAALRRLNVTAPGGGVRFAALLTMGRYPQQHFPQMLIDVAVHPYPDRATARSSTRFVDRRLCEGPLADMVDQAVETVARNLRTYSTVEGTGRVDQLEVSREVLREAVANAVLHREYSPPFQGQPISVDVFPDRIEVASPGGLWGGKTVATLADGQSRCRNATLLQILRKLPLSGKPGSVVEGNGTGVEFMRNQMSAQALPEPHYRAAPDLVTLTLGRHATEFPENRTWLAAVAHRDLTRHEQIVAMMARQFPVLTVELVRDMLQLDSDDVRSVLADLTHDGVLRKDPDGWRRTNAEPMAGKRRARPSPDTVLDVLSPSDARSIREIAELTGLSVGALRPLLKRLVDDGRISPTAPPTSKHRRYVRASPPPRG